MQVTNHLMVGGVRGARVRFLRQLGRLHSRFRLNTTAFNPVLCIGRFAHVADNLSAVHSLCDSWRSRCQPQIAAIMCEARRLAPPQRSVRARDEQAASRI